jgi:hypothetical protein
MDEPKSKAPETILSLAWQQYADMNLNAKMLSRRNTRLRWWVAVLGVLATLFAILTDNYSSQIQETWQIAGLPIGATAAMLLRVLLILTPITVSIIAYLAKGVNGGNGWLVMRAGAEQTLREIYLFRTILHRNANRRDWLADRLADIQRQVYKALGGELAIHPYKGSLPPYYDANNPDSDDGFSDLDGEHFLRFRLDNQLNWHRNKVLGFQDERRNLQIYILAMGGAGTLLASLGGGFAVWVALTAALASAFSGWDQLRNLDDTVRNYSKVILELNITRNAWLALRPSERSTSQFHRMVRSTERVLWSQNAEYIRSMQEALAGLDEGEDLIMETVRASIKADAALKARMEASLVEHATATMDEIYGSVGDTFDVAVGTVAEFAAEEVRQEMQGIREALSDAMQSAVRNMDQIAARVREQFAGEEFSERTTVDKVNAQLKQFPPQGDGIG